ncbi:MAG: hypothetical protein HF975_09330 [ANME-2 cluster archaeon]|nr:hypothetical protein [ANME-2 cluster archaeon]
MIEAKEDEDMRNKFGCISWQQCCLLKYQCYHHCKKSLDNRALKYVLPHPAGYGDGEKVNCGKCRNPLDNGKTIIDGLGD